MSVEFVKRECDGQELNELYEPNELYELNELFSVVVFTAR